MKIIAGVEGMRAPVLEAARRMQTPVMLSANSLWKNGRFMRAWHKLAGLDVHLDSGGYVAMKLYGRFRFTVDEYVQLAAELQPVWWAQMDLCCEPDIAADRAEVFRRIDRTAANLRECRAAAGAVGTKAPMIVLQGWKPADYVSGPAFEDPAFVWPDIVGVGSVCRRHLDGPDGLRAVIGKLDAKLPANVRLHLFGVKSTAAEVLRNHPRIASVDSMAWSVGARTEAREAKISCDNALRAKHLEQWLEQQAERISPAGDTPDLFKTYQQ